MFRVHIIFYLVIAVEVFGELQTLPSLATQLNSTSSLEDYLNNSTDHSLTVGSRMYSIAKTLPTIKNVVIFVCGLTAFMIMFLVFKVYRSGRKIRKTRKYDIITSPAERVEMTPLNEENYEEEDNTVFDVKYR